TRFWSLPRWRPCCPCRPCPARRPQTTRSVTASPRPARTTARPQPIPARAPRPPTPPAIPGSTCRRAPATRSAAAACSRRPRPLTERRNSGSDTVDPIPARAGIGLRHHHYRAVTETRPAVGWLEVHSENYFGGGRPLAFLEAARAHYPLSLHGVGLSLGTDGPLDRNHLARIKALIARLQPGLVSEHVSWSIAGGVYLNDLLPLPYTEEALAVICGHVRETQDFLGRRILVENPSTYLQFAHSSIPEWEFVAEISRRTGCGLLFDVNNVYVSACNHGFDAQA